MTVVGLQAKLRFDLVKNSWEREHFKLEKQHNALRAFIGLGRSHYNCSVIHSTKLPGSQEDSAPPPAVQSIRNGLDQHHRCFGPEKPTEILMWYFLCFTVPLGESCLVCSQCRVSRRTGASPVTVALVPCWVSIPNFLQNSSLFVFLPICPRPASVQDTSSPLPVTPPHPLVSTRIWETYTALLDMLLLNFIES